MALYDLDIDKNLGERVADLKVFYSTDDEPYIFQSIQQIKQSLPNAKYQKFTDKGHFTFEDMHTEEFPELRDYLLRD